MFPYPGPNGIEVRYVIMQGKSRIIIGLVGYFSSGKDAVARHLEQLGFHHISTGDMVREYVREEKLGEPTRDLLIRTGNKLRHEQGGDVLVRRALGDSHRRLVISGLRALPEALAIKKAGGVLVAVAAPIERRFEWARSRGRITDGVTFEEFSDREETESRGKAPYEQNLKGVIEMADVTLENTGTLDELKKKVAIMAQNISAQ
jgi:dephospho-CoA kinase